MMVISVIPDNPYLRLNRIRKLRILIQLSKQGVVPGWDGFRQIDELRKLVYQKRG